MSISHKNNRALKRVLQCAMRDPAHAQQVREPAKPAYSIGTDIPESYNDTYVRAIPTDPQNSFVYWEMPKGQAQKGSFGDKGSAHVGNGDADKIRETLTPRSTRSAQRAAVQPWRNNTHQHSRDDNLIYGQGGNHTNRHDNTHRHSRDDNHTYSQDNNHIHSQDDNHTHWWNGNNHHHWQDNHHHHHQQKPGDLGRYLVRHEDSDDYRYAVDHYLCGENSQSTTLYAMAESLIDQCGHYLSECRQGESGAFLPIPSSGELYGGVNNAGSHTVVSPLSSGVFCKPRADASSEQRP